MHKNDILDMRKYPELDALFWDATLMKDKMPAREAFCTLARRVGIYVNPEDLDEKEKMLLDELFRLFEEDIPEVFYNGWKGEKIYTGECLVNYPPLTQN